MSYSIVEIRPLTPLELERSRELRQLITKRILLDRRQMCKLFGVSAFASMAISGIKADPAHAQDVDASDLIRAWFDGAIELSKGLFYKQEKISAEFNLTNDADSGVAKPVYNEVRSEKYGRTAFDFKRVRIPPRSAVIVRHSGFRAKHEGENSYGAMTQIDEASTPFSVTG